MKVLGYDTETTGLPDWKQPSEAPHQPHLVELAAILFDTDTLAVHDHFTALIRPNGWTWDANDEAFQTHGITFERAMDEGIDEADALAQFHALHNSAELRVGHNESFDARLLRIAIKRYGYGLAGDATLTQDERDNIADLFKARPAYCTCNAAKPIIKLPPTPKMLANPRFRNGFKAPNLDEAHRHFFGRPHEGAHRAMADADAAARLYLALTQPARIDQLPVWLVLPPPTPFTGAEAVTMDALADTNEA